MSTRPGWYPDPSGRYPKRWHDGVDWTASVLSNDGQQGFDQLPPAGAPPVASLHAAPAAPRPASPAPPPPSGASAPAPAPSPWEPAQSWQSPPAASPSPPPASAGGSWQPGQPWRSAPSQSAQPYTPATSGGVWAQQQQPVTTASLGLTPPPAVRASGSVGGSSTVGLAISGVGVALIALSLFVLDWADGVTFGDIRTGVIDFDPPEWPDKVVKIYMQWLGYLWLPLTGIAVAFATGGRSAARHLGHVGAAILAGIGAVLAAFVIVRGFRGPGADPEFGAWLLPAGYLVLLVAVVVSARDE